MQTHEKEVRRRMVDLDGRVIRLRNWLAKFGDHLKDCPCRNGNPQGCNCGFDKVKHRKAD